MQTLNHTYHLRATTEQINGNSFSVNRLLFENPQRLAYLIEKFNYDKNKTALIYGNSCFLWSRIVREKKALKVEILRLVIDLIFKNSPLSEKREAFLLSYWLIFTKKYERPFKLVNNSLMTSPIVSIWCLYQYILKGTAIKAVDEYSLKPFECCTCYEVVASQSAFCSNCTPKKGGFLCGDCFDGLNVLRCPLCMSRDLQFNAQTVEDIRSVSFTHNRREFSKMVSFGLDFTLCYFDGVEMQITPINVKNLGALCVVALRGYLDNINPEDDCSDLFPCIANDFKFMFPNITIFKNYVYSLNLDTQTGVIARICDFNNPSTAYDFYCEHIGNPFNPSPLDFDSLHVERIAVGNSAAALFINMPEGCNIYSFFKKRDEKLFIYPYAYNHDFHVITP